MLKKTERQELMGEALCLARKARGRTFPNPAVGAVVVRGRNIVGRGYHEKRGKPHAEVVALKESGRLARGADLYVTLEPCCHRGATPPCTDAIMAAGLKRVYAAVLDPNPLVNGKGVRALRRQGIEVNVGLLGKAARKVNESYFKFMTRRRPFVTLKIAQTLDGRIATASGDSKWITSAASRRLVKHMRSRSQAVLVGINTVLADDPMLLPSPMRSTHYYRCVLDSCLRIPPDSNLVRGAAGHSTMVYFNHGSKKSIQYLETHGVTLVRIQKLPGGGLDIGRVLEHMGGLGVMDLMVEGGAGVFTSFLRGGHADKLVVFLAPNIMGGVHSLNSILDLGSSTVQGISLEVDCVERVSRDIMLTLYPRKVI